MNKPAVAIALPQFSGPLDLLLHLIERDELDITALSLAAVTDQYLAQVEALQENKLTQLIDFIVVGARLMVIKSRALLPTPPSAAEPGDDVEDPAEALVRQLRLYKQFKQAAVWLQDRAAAGLRAYLRLAPTPRGKARLDPGAVTAETLWETAAAVLARAAERRESAAIAAPRLLTIEGQIDRLRTALRAQTAVPFDALLSEQASRVELSVTLLAVLELVKRREAEAQQESLFGPITLRPGAPAEPDDAAI